MHLKTAFILFWEETLDPPLWDDGIGLFILILREVMKKNKYFSSILYQYIQLHVKMLIISASADGGPRSLCPLRRPPSTLAEMFRRKCLGGGGGLRKNSFTEQF
jgi:hypothetical protein